MARLTTHTDEIGDEILERLANGEYLHVILASSDTYPVPRTFYSWLDKVQGFREKYNQARETQIVTQIDMCAEKLNDLNPIYCTGSNMNGDTFGQATAAVAKIDLQLKTLQWLAAITKPARYGKNAAGSFKLDPIATPVVQTQQLLLAVSNGDLTPADGNAIKSIIQVKDDLQNSEDIQARLAQVESILKERGTL